MKNGGPAFPQQKFHPKDAATNIPYYVESTGGMTLRDWFAGQALVGLLTNEGNNEDQTTMDAWDLADRMLENQGVTE